MDTSDMVEALNELIGTGYLTPQEEDFLDDMDERLYDYAGVPITPAQHDKISFLYLKHKHRI